MDRAPAGIGSDTGVETTMVDLARLNLADLAGLAELNLANLNLNDLGTSSPGYPERARGNALEESLRRLLRDASHPEETLAGFQSSL